MTSILLVDDEQDLTWAIGQSLGDEGYQVYTANDGLAALTLARQQRPHLIVLDIMMPALDGLQVCHQLRRDPLLAAVPILFLTMRSAIEDRLRGLDEGCDDYLAKPFDLRELKARIRALLRRARPTQYLPAAEPPIALVRAGDLTLDLHTCQVSTPQATTQLTPAEFDLLHYLMRHPGQIFSSQYLLQHVWGYAPEAAEPGLVRWHMMNLRNKIEPTPSQPIYISTVPRHGYRLAPTP